MLPFASVDNKRVHVIIAGLIAFMVSTTRKLALHAKLYFNPFDSKQLIEISRTNETLKN